MKREVCCDACARSWLRTNGIKTVEGKVPEAKVFEIAHGEAIKQVRGTLIVGALCDGCGTELRVGTVAVAVSVYSDRYPYFAWESEWIEGAGA